MSNMIRLATWCVILFSLSFIVSLTIQQPEEVRRVVRSTLDMLSATTHKFFLYWDPFTSLFLFGLFVFGNRMIGGSLTSSERSSS